MKKLFDSTDKAVMQKVFDKCAFEFRQYGISTQNILMTFSGGEAIYRNQIADIRTFTGKQAIIAKNIKTSLKNLILD